MEILINELSLDGQFNDEEEFLDNFDSILKIVKLIELLNFSLLKEYMLFDRNITANFKLVDFSKSKNDRARKFKSFLLKLAQNPPFWNIDKKHNCSDVYQYSSKNICDTSLAESCERDKIILSFKHDEFKNLFCNVLKNQEPINLLNIININMFLDYLFKNGEIGCFDYCKNKFKDSKVNFEKINDGYGFDSLKTSQQEKEFIEAFELFDRTDWANILTSEGLEYKPYSASKSNNWFKGTEFENNSIYKFRVTQKYRCFGYRNGDIFYILRFEIDHKISDNG
ncbi:hypothetical protein PT502_03740 [Aliarcobacter butzleri]|uniref:hypothetical protein n=1 Tax=Aliarcobacter butzleri TaxID=28197 RepID=UPI0024DEDE72|nr:hypothetical protein [Aliarcobacter butzleri]MDK2082907.1 hypothetical protein [Aliarcobacter butzleri]